MVLTGLGSDQIIGGDLIMLADYLKGLHVIRLFSELKHYSFSKNIIKNKLIIPLLPDTINNILRYLLNKPKKICDDHKSSDDNMYGSIEKNKHKMFYSQQKALNDIIGMHTTYMADRTPYQLGGRNNIEFRHPFYDKRLVEFSLTLPPYMKLNKGVSKIILRDAMKDELPEIVRKRTDKGEYTPVIELYLKKMIFQKISDKNIIEELSIMSQEELSIRYEKDPWSIRGLESWLRHHFRKN